jgi:hypothetical protein
VKFLMKIPPREIETPPAAEDIPRLVTEIDGRIRSLYTDALDRDDDTRLTDSNGEDYTFGFDKPEVLRNVAKRWNKRIRQNVARAAQPFCIQTEEIKLDSHETYQLLKASYDADNRFFPFSDYLAVVPGERFDRLLPQITKEMEADVAAHPELYCLVTVYPKSEAGKMG